MTDRETLDVIAKRKITNIDMWLEAVLIAAKRLEECQWHDYVENDCRFRLGMDVILGIRYDDGSKGSVNGYVMYDEERGSYLTVDYRYKNRYNENAIIEKWMKYPDYN